MPVNLRFYPSEDDFYCLNADAPKLQESFTHAHIGTREIAIIQDNIHSEAPDWQDQALNGMRAELAVLFVEQISDRRAPPGLAEGVGGYVRDPFAYQEAFVRTQLLTDQFAVTWRQLWENPAIIGDPKMTLEATSTVAYLVDTFGWSKFTEFLKSLASADNYQESLSQVYNVEMNALQRQWAQYLPFYLKTRWQAHAIYNYDLSAYAQLVAAGAYSDSVDLLKKVITELEAHSDKEKLAEAQALYQKALAGQEAGALVSQARQALLSKDYNATISLAEQARQKYLSIGDERRLGEIDSYENWAQEVLDLRQELTQLEEDAAGNPNYNPPPRLKEIGLRLGYLGDEGSLARVNTLFSQAVVRDQQQSNLMVGIGLILCLVLLIYLVLALHRRPHSEALL